PTVAESVKLRGQRGGRFIPLHTTVHPRITFTRSSAVTLCDELPWPIAPSSARLRCNNARVIQSRKSRCSVQWVVLIASPVAEDWQSLQRILDRRSSRFVRGAQRNWPHKRGKQNRPAAALR